MSANPIWIAAYGGPPPAAVGASAVWIAPGDGTAPSAVASYIAGYFNPVAGASPVWIAGHGGPPPAAIGATPITIVGYGGFGGSVAPPVTSVWSAADAAANGMTLSNGGLYVTQGSTANTSIRGTVSHTSGKVYVEFYAVNTIVGVGNERLGFASAGFNAGGQIGQSNYSGGYGYGALADVRIGSAGFTTNYTTTQFPHLNDVWAFAVDFSTGNMWLAINNVWINSSDPVAGTLPYITFLPATVGALFPALTMQGANEGPWALQPTAASQKYAPPSGFSAWG
jgi:hypothetical protein